MSARPFPRWMYGYPDDRNIRIAELETALLTSNDGAAKLREELEDTKKLLNATLDVRDRQSQRIHELCEQARP